MRRPRPRSPRFPAHNLALAAALVVALATVAGCGGTATPAAPSSSAQAPQAVSSSATASPAAPGPGALTGEAASAAAGDIPDNQVFLTFRNTTAGYSMKYPEGWAQKGAGGDITFRDKNNIVHVTVTSGPVPTIASVKAQLAQLAATTTSFSAGQPATMTISGAPAVKVTYTTKSAPSAVTGQSVTLIVDRYYLSHGGKVAVVDLGTPQGVDNIDAYRMMIESLRWGA